MIATSRNNLQQLNQGISEKVVLYFVADLCDSLSASVPKLATKLWAAVEYR